MSMCACLSVSLSVSLPSTPISSVNYVLCFVNVVFVIFFVSVVRATSIDEHSCYSGSPPLCFIIMIVLFYIFYKFILHRMANKLAWLCFLNPNLTH